MREDGQMSSQLQCSFEGVNGNSPARLSPCIHRSPSGEEGSLQRSLGTNGFGSTSPIAASRGTTFNNRSEESALAKHRLFAPSSRGIFAPPSTPSPHYGFRRNTANIMTAGRRVSHRSSSAPPVVSDDRCAPNAWSSGNAQEVLPSTQSTTHTSGVSANGLVDRGSSGGDYGNHLTSTLRSGPRSARGAAANAGTGSTASGTLPSSPSHHSQYNGASGGMVGASAAGDRYVTLRDSTLLMDGGKAAVAQLGGDHALSEFDRQSWHRHHTLGRDGSNPSMLIEKQGISSPRLHHYCSPSVALSHAAVGGSAATERNAPRDGKENGEEAKSRRHHSRHARVTTSLTVESPARASALSTAPPSSAQFVGFSLAQQQRFEGLQERGPSGHELARWKMLELMRYWMSMQSTRGSLDAVIRDALVDAGIAKARQAWGGSDARAAASRPSVLSAELPQAGGLNQSNTPCASPPSIEAPPAKVSPKNKLIEKVAALEGSSDPSSLTPQSDGSNRRRGRPKNDMTPVGDEVLTSSANHTAPASAPASLSVSISVFSSPLEERSSTPPQGETGAGAEVAEVFSVPSTRRHRRKGDRDVSSAEEKLSCPPNGLLSQPSGGVEGSKNDLIASQPLGPQVAPMIAMGGGASAGEAALGERTETANDAKVCQHQEAVPTSLHPSTSEAALTSSPHISASRHHRSRRSKSRGAVPRQEATYEEIPQFYFPLGRPTTHEALISGPLYTKHENPFLRIADGVSVTTPVYDGGESSPLGASAEALVRSGDDSMLLSQSRQLQKVPPMSQLHALDDRQVGHYIQREFGRLPPFPRHTQRVRLLGGRLRGGGRSQSNLPFAKQELLYKQQFVQCMQRLCGHCFGIPRYFAFLIMRLIQWEMHKSSLEAAGDTNSPQRRCGSSRLTSSSSLLSSTPSGGGSASAIPSVFLITAQNTKDFYEIYLKNKDPVRRIFDLLIMSSFLPTSSGVGESSVGMSATSEESAPSASTSAISLSALSLRPYLLPKDFVAYINILLTYHPGLAFLRQTPDFQMKYLDTVIYRIFYELDRFDRGSISYSEVASSRLIDAFRQVDSAEDINTVLSFFSYEHFYVLYCRFWELDEDRDMLLAPEDLMRYAPENVMNPLIVQRVFAGVGRRRRCNVPTRIGYEDFVWFCLSEEDKSTPQAIRYWFRVLDLDGDGVLSVYELRGFYDATRSKIAEYVQEGLVSFEDVVCQVFDMMRCSEYRGLSLSDLLREPQAAAVALNLLTSVVKFLQFEQRDPFVLHHERLLGGPEQSTWDHFARAEYDRMALEADREG